ncbi:MAG: beta strand repeat-containing protein, partial [Xenococcus sp. (in: cyanobacteria)]
STSVNTFGEGKGGDINIITNSLNLTNGGLVSASILGQGNAGSVKIIANDTITIDGETSSGFGSGAISLVETEAVGDAGSVTINTGNLNLTNGGRVSTITLGQGNAGSVNITANNTVNIDGETSDGSPNSGAFSTSSSGAVGNAGGVAINTESLTITNGGIVSTSTFGQGNAGAINITASDTIDIDGEGSDANVSQVISFVSSNAVGNSGGITITTSSLSLTNGGQVDSSTRGQCNAGDINITATDAVTFDGEGGFLGIFQSGAYSDVGSNAVGNSGGVTINTSSLSLTNGGRVDSSTFGQGNAGAINIIARDIVSIDGEGSLGIFNSGTYSDVRSNAVGNSGGVTITTGSLSLTNGGEISASTSGQGNAGDIKITARDIVSIDGEGSLGLSSIIRSTVVDRLGVFKAGTGKPGNIEIQANSLSLSNQARIEATTQSKTGENANINLQLTEDLIFFDNSLISASAFEEADGGNINIDADFIIAFPNQNNDIVANASQGKGGNIDIDALSLFGIEERTSNNITNDINASSELGLQGNISINTPEIDPTSGLVELPEAVADATDQISQNICEQGRESEFIITGKGGLPPNPHETLNSDEEQVDLVDLVQPGPLPRQTVGANGIRPNNPRPEKSTSELVPARGWIFNDKGEVTLTSYKTANTEIRQSQPKNLPTCSNGI